MESSIRSNYQAIWALAGVALGVLLLALNETIFAMVQIWRTSSSFNHCILIAPVSAVLIWRRRDRLARSRYRPAPLGLALFAACAGLWGVGALGQVATLQYFAVAAMIPTAIWAVIGTAAAREIAFPLAYLFFMVPIGQFLVPWLMELTAEFTVWTARLSGVSVYKDGLFFTIPSGSFKIVEACSGLRMLIASLAVGVLFAHLVFRSWSKRILFMAAIVIMSLIANTIRAYIVVMIAYYRGMDAVADHITLGYVVFGAVLVVTLAVGSRFADADPADETGPGNASPPEVQPSLWPALLAGSAIVTIVLSTPVAVGALQARAASHPAAPAVLLPMAVADWRGPVDASPGWAPQFSGYDKAYSGNYTRGLDAVDVFVISYARQKQGAELINSENRLFDADHWTQLSHGSGVFESAGGSINYLQDELQGSSGDKRLVRYWYVVDGDPRYRPAAIKLQEFMNSLLGRPTPESLVAISATFRDEPARAPEALDAFIRDVYANTYPLE